MEFFENMESVIKSVEGLGISDRGDKLILLATVIAGLMLDDGVSSLEINGGAMKISVDISSEGLTHDQIPKEQLIEYLKESTQNASGMFEISEDTICALMSMLASPPAPVSVPAAMEMDDDFDSAFEHGKAVGWNAYRAAMLQAEPVSNSDELPLDYLQGHKDGLEWAAQLAEANHPQTGDWLYDDQIDLARAIRKGPDMPTVQGGNSPVIPDDVRRMDWLVSKTVDVREPMVYGSHSLFWSQTITDEEDDYHATKLREQIDAAMAAEQAAAPQQEAE